MASLSPDLIRSLAEAGDDFGFEMRVGKILRGLPSADVTHGGLYHPLGFNQAQRQYDYRVKVANSNRIVRIAMECKNFFIGSPVVLCGAPRSEAESRLDFVVSDLRFVIERGSGEQKYLALPLKVTPSPLFPVGDFVGKSVIRPEPTTSKEREVVKGSGYRLTGDSEVWERWNQAVTHAAVLASAGTGEFRKQRTFTFTAALPVVVVPDECLWTIGYDEDGKIAHGPNKVDVAALYVGSHHTVDDGVTVQLSHIHLMTLTGLRAFVDELSRPDSAVWKNIFPEPTLAAYTSTRTKPLQF